MDSLNVWCGTGWLERAPVLVESSNGPPYAKFTVRLKELARSGQVWKTYTVCESYGFLIDPTLRLQPGDLVSISGSLKWRGNPDKTKPGGQLVVFTKTLSCLSAVGVAAE
jgi:hypothetical protein